MMAVATVLLGGVFAVSHADPAHKSTSSTPPPAANAGSGCTQLTEDHVVGLRPDDTETKASDGDGLGRRHYFRTLEGALIPQVTPPSGFDPQAASDQELHTFGYPERPGKSDSKRANWDHAWGFKNKVDDKRIGYCETYDAGNAGGSSAQPQRLGSITIGQRVTSEDPIGPCKGTYGLVLAQHCYDPNWAGGAVHAPTNAPFHTAQATWYQTGFKSPNPCGDTSTYLTFAGLGGYAGGLMQAGTLNDNNIPNAGFNYWYKTYGDLFRYSKMFWEVVPPGGGTSVPPQYVFTYYNQNQNPPNGWVGVVDGGVAPGGPDQVSAYVAYYQPTQKGQFIVSDLTQNVSLSTGYFNQVTTQETLPKTMDQYWDGTTAEFITERGQAQPQQPLRDPFYDTTAFTAAYADGNTISPTAYSWTQISEQVTANHDIIQTSNFNGNPAWTNTWSGCS
jgi:hypothetical protein